MTHIQKLSILLFLVAVSCSPKTTKETTEVPDKPVTTTPTEKLSPCKNWTVPVKNEDAETNYVIYRDFLKLKQYDNAFNLWKKVYEIAPAADGKRKTVYEDGIKLYHYYFKQSGNEAERKDFVNRIMRLHDEIGECYEDEAYASGRKAFDYYYNYPTYTNSFDIYKMFMKSIDGTGLHTQAFVINPFTALLIEMHKEEKISMAEAQKYALLIPQILKEGETNCKEKECNAWGIVRSYAPERLSEFEAVKNFYDCSYYKQKYIPAFDQNSGDCEVVNEVYSTLRWGSCDDMDAEMMRVKKIKDQNCRVVVEAGTLRSAYNALENGNYREAIKGFEAFVEKTDDNQKKAKYSLLIGKIYYAHLKQFSTARKYALLSAKYNPNAADPYLLIGKLYASSGPLCGPGRGWDSQVVTWPAIDMFNKAARLEPGSKAGKEAAKLASKYKQYMPSMEDIFQRGLKVGDSYFVPCWIQQNTKIRAASN